MDIKTQLEIAEELKQWRKENNLDQKKTNPWGENPKFDKPGTMDDSVATFWYIVAMFCASIFQERIVVWILLTIVYMRFKNRHKRR